MNDSLESDGIRADKIYTTADIMRLLKVSSETLANWCKIGLRHTRVSLHPRAKRFVYGAKLIDFLDAYGMALRILSASEEWNEGEGGGDE